MSGMDTEPLLSQRRLNDCFQDLRIDPFATAMESEAAVASNNNHQAVEQNQRLTIYPAAYGHRRLYRTIEGNQRCLAERVGFEPTVRY